jgi:hypothetical protein
MECSAGDRGSPHLVPHSQLQSTFFSVFPLEIRLEIFSQLFHSTRLTYGFVEHHSRSVRLMRPAPESVAIIETCRRMRQEIGDSWIGQILFNFTDSMYMSVLLGSWPQKVLTKIRRLRVANDPTIRRVEKFVLHHQLVPALQLLPGLRLDSLIILGSGVPELDYMTVNELVKHSDGWKTLFYLCPDSRMLAFKHHPPIFGETFDNDTFLRQPQPETWRKTLLLRDGYISHPSIKILRSTLPGVRKSITDPTTRVPFEQADTGTHAQYGKHEEANIMGDQAERSKELIVIVRRGTGIDYTQQNVPYEPQEQHWPVGPQSSTHSEDDPLADLSSDDDISMEYGMSNQNHPCAETDQYAQVEDFEWPDTYPNPNSQ